MPVRKFRSVEGMKRSLWREPGDPGLYRAIAALWAFGMRTAARHFPPGVYKHRSIEEMNRQTERWNEANSRTHAARIAAHLGRS